MKIKAELYGSKIGVDGNLVELMMKKKCKILLTVTSDDNVSKYQMVINNSEAKSLIESLTKCLDSDSNHGFVVID